MPVRLHHLFVAGGLVAGIAAGALLIQTDPSLFGWILGAGAGLAAGAFVAAIVSGEPLASSGGGGSGTRSRRRGPNPALRHFDISAPPSANGKHEHSASETGDASRDRLN